MLSVFHERFAFELKLSAIFSIFQPVVRWPIHQKETMSKRPDSNLDKHVLIIIKFQVCFISELSSKNERPKSLVAPPICFYLQVC